MSPPYLQHRFKLQPSLISNILQQTPQFGYNGFSEVIYYEHYSRQKDNQKHEIFGETILRIVEGTMSIYKNHMLLHNLPYDEEEAHKFAAEMAQYMFEMKFLPAGRGLFANGTKFMYERGSSALANCGYTNTKDLANDAYWTLDMLMNGCGIGFGCDFRGEIFKPLNYEWFAEEGKKENNSNIHVVADTKEGWAASTKALINAFLQKEQILPIFDYSLVRPKGAPLKTFGGVSGGADPLIILHKRILGYFSMFAGLRRFEKNMEEYSKEISDGIIKPPSSKFLWHDYFSYLKKIGDLSSIPTLSDETFQKKTYGHVRLVTDIFNAIGIAVVSGNIRRSAEIAFANADDLEFYSLKDYALNPERAAIGWMSNNSVRLSTKEEFGEYIPKIVEQFVANNTGEPGILNVLNAKRYGRVNAYRGPGTILTREAEEDSKICGTNPCGEIILEDKEVCNLAEIFLDRGFIILKKEKNLSSSSSCGTGCKCGLNCKCGPNCQCPKIKNSKSEKSLIFDEEAFHKAIKFATFYCICVSILPTHSSATNKIVTKNHRIGISLSSVTKLLHHFNYSKTIDILSKGYKQVRQECKYWADICGIPEPIRVTTIKPSGTISLLTGSAPGAHFPVAGRYVIRRVRIGENSRMVKILKEAGYYSEPDSYSVGTLVFDFPIDQGDYPSEEDVNIWKQISIVQMLQRRWSDNSVSVTIKYNKDEMQDLEQIITSIIPNVKSLSFLPRNDMVYKQAPYEAISREKYEELRKGVKEIDWTEFINNDQTDGIMPKFCDGESCTL